MYYLNVFASILAYMKTHNHFKLTDQDLSHIFNTPGKLTLFVAVFVTVILCTLILIQMDLQREEKSVQILSQADQIKRDNQLVMIENYEKETRQILNSYLQKRTEPKFASPETCQSLVNQTITQVLNLIVPVDYKEFHLQLVVLLDKENQACLEGDKLDEEWSGLLEKYVWLSE